MALIQLIKINKLFWCLFTVSFTENQEPTKGPDKGGFPPGGRSGGPVVFKDAHTNNIVHFIIGVTLHAFPY